MLRARSPTFTQHGMIYGAERNEVDYKKKIIFFPQKLHFQFSAKVLVYSLLEDIHQLTIRKCPNILKGSE